MILQALKGYYEREKENLPPFGFSEEQIAFIIILDRDGKVVGEPRDLRKEKGKVDRRLVPLAVQNRSGSFKPTKDGRKANFTWDNSKYALGVTRDKTSKELIISPGEFEEFKKRQLLICDGVEDERYKAFRNFLDNWKPKLALELPLIEEISGKGRDFYVIFAFERARNFIFESESVSQAWLLKLKTQLQEEQPNSFCLITGERATIARLHNQVKGVGNKGTVAKLVGFNEHAYESYGKKQSFNAPTSEEAAFEYVTALNTLLFDDSHHIHIGNKKDVEAITTVVFWAGERSGEQLGDALQALFNGTKGDNEKIRQYFEVLKKGELPATLNPDTRYYILGLSLPSKSRIAVRFWYPSTVEEVHNWIVQHFKDLEIERRWDNEPEHPSLFLLIQQFMQPTKKPKDAKKVEYSKGEWKRINKLTADFLKSALTGQMYPLNLLNHLVNRCKHDGDVSYLQAALIKAYLVRLYRKLEKSEQLQEVNEVGLNLENKNQAYLLGRLFAVFEAAQEEAHKPTKLNRTIADTYFSTVSMTPWSAFPTINRLYKHHLKKIDNERYRIRYEKFVDEITDKMSDEIPTYLKLKDQGLFFLGYYHQKNAIYKKHDKQDNDQVKEN
ncbi:type I-C CRISPR-associated protein Cas8c/Csd1 [bacterium]|nr:type I-C CRISPR-associated protein Cas8c/Csd1 [bacterium]